MAKGICERLIAAHCRAPAGQHLVGPFLGNNDKMLLHLMDAAILKTSVSFVVVLQHNGHSNMAPSGMVLDEASG